MLFAVIICKLFVFTSANPFHKYPFVFLLDVGNEELEKTNSEQIRLSVPGGSVALRYPAIGNGDTISHVRVSGIDFGTDLKANIVDGGPGYKYVVLVFIGNQGVPYDAVLTVQTVTDDTVFNIQNIGAVVNSKSNTDKSEEEANNSAEDLNDAEVGETQDETLNQNSNIELMQSSANIYSYAEKESVNDNADSISDDTDNSEVASNDSDELVNDDSDESDEYNEASNEKDIHMSYVDNTAQNDDTGIQIISDETENEEDDDNGESESSSNVETSYDYANSNPIIVDDNLYAKYKILRDHLNLGRQVYSQEEFLKNYKSVYQEDPSDYEENYFSGSMYDAEFSNKIDKDMDFNNNYVDSEDSYAVAY